MVSKKERDAWTFIYRLYEEFASQLRDADAERASLLIAKACEKLPSYKDPSDAEQIIILAGYDLLDAVWKASHK